MQWSTYPPSGCSQTKSNLVASLMTTTATTSTSCEIPHSSHQTVTVPAPQAETSSLMESNSLPNISLDLADNSTTNSTYDEMKFFNVDQFTIDNFKAECLLNLDSNLMTLDHKCNDDQQQIQTSYGIPQFPQVSQETISAENFNISLSHPDEENNFNATLQQSHSTHSLLQDNLYLDMPSYELLPLGSSKSSPTSPSSALLMLDKTSLALCNIGIEGISDLSMITSQLL